MDLMEKLTILADSAKYDAACTSSGADRPGKTVTAGCCHSFSADGRCISLLKVLMTNQCIYDCKYCVNRASNDCRRTAFTPEELAELTIEFYRRNYIEGLFLSSGVVRSPDYTMEQMIGALQLLRYRHNFWGYIHAKTIPGASPELVRRLGLLADRLSINVELPSEQSLRRLAPHKKREAIFSPMKQICQEAGQNRQELAVYKKAEKFAPAGQATQMIIGASPETDYQIITLAQAMYGKYALKRVFYSAYIPAVEDALLPALDVKPPLLREHRLYQADWLMRQYGFGAEEILSPETPNFNPYLDPKCNWAVGHMQQFPVDVNTAALEELLRVPGIGPTSARRIVAARRNGRLGLSELKNIGVVLKRAQYFIRTSDWPTSARPDRETTVRALIDPKVYSFGMEQLSLFEETPGLRPLPTARDVKSMAEAVEETVLCLASSL
ncbi:putative DNA modification/repair radical SAM protein [Sporobacter termitidis DSM 10068]|uniref:Putative DNA modification/repair radical SAM protein n=1 Tax=Sporobacter termitidis DSM 10068 TaxID=1123282 RepID=A0A1M5ZGE2_9FIRM|nr:putative DNA modification/repair radical SAM protein [Sporobacter termitidis]SHI22973.1 putative DNA modification/repair radical SAM protein [Sporobacter termitidis DSM 10068]